MHPKKPVPPVSPASAPAPSPAHASGPVSTPCSASADTGAARRRRRPAPDAELRRWLAKYEPVERVIMEERARRLASAERRRMKRRLAMAAECEATEGLAKAMRGDGLLRCGKRRGMDARSAAPSRSQGPDLPLARIGSTGLHVLDGGMVSVFLWALGVKCTRDVDAMRHSLKRPLYYARENERRRALAAERRRVRLRTTPNPCPTREEVLDAWVHAKDSREAMLRFGGMLEDLECYVDNSLRFGAHGEVVGRAPGVKGWLQTNIPALYSKYKTVMRCKAAAKRLRQVVGLKDPMPVSAILAPAEEFPKTSAENQDEMDGSKTAAGGRGVPPEDLNEIMMRTESNGAEERHEAGEMQGREDGCGPTGLRAKDELQTKGEEELRTKARLRGEEELRRERERLAVEALRARAVYLEAMDGVPDNATRTIQRLDELLDPERIEDATMLKAWKERYENEITLRTKSRWLNRLFGVGRRRRDRETA